MKYHGRRKINSNYAAKPAEHDHHIDGHRSIFQNIKRIIKVFNYSIKITYRRCVGNISP